MTSRNQPCADVSSHARTDAEPSGAGCACGLNEADCHPDCPHKPIGVSIYVLRAYQRHYMLRSYGADGHVLPVALKASRALDDVLDTLDRTMAALQSARPDEAARNASPQGPAPGGNP